MVRVRPTGRTEGQGRVVTLSRHRDRPEIRPTSLAEQPLWFAADRSGYLLRCRLTDLAYEARNARDGVFNVGMKRGHGAMLL